MRELRSKYEWKSQRLCIHLPVRRASRFSETRDRDKNGGYIIEVERSIKKVANQLQSKVSSIDRRLVPRLNSGETNPRFWVRTSTPPLRSSQE
jgi:hypothetical protein